MYVCYTIIETTLWNAHLNRQFCRYLRWNHTQTKRRHSGSNTKYLYTIFPYAKDVNQREEIREICCRELIYKQSNLKLLADFFITSTVYISVYLFLFLCNTITHLGWANEALQLPHGDARNTGVFEVGNASRSRSLLDLST